MKIKVINNKLSHFKEQFKVTKLNYDMIVAEKDDKKIIFSKEDVEIIPENSYEDTLLKYEDILKIKLDRGISQEFYITLIGRLEDVINTEIKSINLLQDNFKIIKKGLWEKRLLLVLNDEIALDITVTANNYSNIFNFMIRDVTLKDFVVECEFQVEALEKEIKEKQRQIAAYRKAVKDVVINYGNGKDLILKLSCGKENLVV